MDNKDTIVHHRFGNTTIAVTLLVRKQILSHDFIFAHTVSMGEIYRCKKCKYLIYLRRRYHDEVQLMFYRPDGLERDLVHIKLMECNEAKMKDLLL